MVRKRLAVACTVALVVGLLGGVSPVSAQEGMPFVTVTTAPEEAEVEAGEHIPGQEFTESRPLAHGHVDAAPAFLADDEYGCSWATAQASGLDDWVGVARRGQGTDVNPGNPEPDRCAGFQSKFTAATAAGANGLIVVSHVPLDGNFLAASAIPGVMLAPDPGERLIASLDPGDPEAVELSLWLLDPETFLPSWEVAATEVVSLNAASSNGSVAVSGTARFRGEPPIVVGTDMAGNPPIHSALAQLGLDATEIALRRPDPNMPEIEFVIRVTEMNSEPPPEVVRYLWQFMADGEEYWVQAKTSDVTTGTAFADDPAGTLQNIPGSFRLRGDCGRLVEPPAPNVRSCRHLAWLDGVFDTTRNEVRIRLPLNLAVAPHIRPGTVLDEGIMDASVQAAISNDTTSNRVTQITPYEIPQREVLVGIVPSGAAPAFTDSASVSGFAGNFSATLDTGGLGAGDYDVWVRACLGENCDEAVTSLTL
jgi:hypothetical protein